MAVGLARHQVQSDAAANLARRLRQGSLFGHIAAHERLDEQQAQALMQWLINGAR